MSRKPHWKLIILSLMLALPFLFGLLEPIFRAIFRGDTGGYYLLNTAAYYVLFLVLTLGFYSIINFASKKGFKGLFLGILILLVLIPLALLGTCVPFAAGNYLRGLFIK